jgi:hypothetical protein
MSEQLPRSVEVDLPTDVEAIIAAHEAPDEGEVWTTVLHGALWEMRARGMGREAVNRELHDEISEALGSVDRGEGVEATPAWWKQFWRRCEENHGRIEIARKEGLVGNLLLPEKLYDFVTAEVVAGRFASATDLVSEAVRKCSWRWERDDAAG